MKSRIILIFALFLTLTSFSVGEKVVKQSDMSILLRVSTATKAPQITQQLKDVTVCDGEPGEFKLGVADLIGCSFNWLRDGKPIVAPSADYEVSSGKQYIMLKIKKVKKEHAGRYTVVVKNSAGEVKSEARLTVTAQPKS